MFCAQVLVRGPDDGAEGALRPLALGRPGRNHTHGMDQDAPDVPHRSARHDQQGALPG